MTPSLWYAAYGSNLHPRRFGRYLGVTPDAPGFPPHAWLPGKGQIRFGGRSRRWAGGVAFVDAEPATSTVWHRCYQLTVEQLAAVWAGENGMDPEPAMVDLLCSLIAEPAAERTAILPGGRETAKYETARVVATDPFGDRRCAVTLTSVVDHGARAPSEDYLATIAAGLADAPLTPLQRRRYLASLGDRAPGPATGPSSP